MNAWRGLLPGDIAVLVTAVALLAGLWLGLGSGGDSREVAVTRSSGPAFSVPTWTRRQLDIDGPLGTTRVEIADGAARIIESPCRQKLCIRAGWLREAGETAACVPNRVAISMLAGDARFDAVSF